MAQKTKLMLIWLVFAGIFGVLAYVPPLLASAPASEGHFVLVAAAVMCVMAALGTQAKEGEDADA